MVTALNSAQADPLLRSGLRTSRIAPAGRPAGTGGADGVGMKNLVLAVVVASALGCSGPDGSCKVQEDCSRGFICMHYPNGAKCIVPVQPAGLGEQCWPGQWGSADTGRFCASGLTCGDCTSPTCTVQFTGDCAAGGSGNCGLCTELRQEGERCVGSGSILVTGSVCGPSLLYVRSDGSSDLRASGVCSADGGIPPSRTCDRVNGAVTECRPAKMINEVCGERDGCEYPLFCLNTLGLSINDAGVSGYWGVCARPGQEGETCMTFPMNRPCAVGLRCDTPNTCDERGLCVCRR